MLKLKLFHFGWRCLIHGLALVGAIGLGAVVHAEVISSGGFALPGRTVFLSVVALGSILAAGLGFLSGWPVGRRGSSGMCGGGV